MKRFHRTGVLLTPSLAGELGRLLICLFLPVDRWFE
jgi:hypothetical protein